MGRKASIDRQTGETQIHLDIDLDGSGVSKIVTGVGFLDHMLTLFAKHSLFDLNVQATGDLEVDDHHTVEDVGICLGLALAEAVGDKRGISRYGFFFLPMDETLAGVALDLSGRAAIVWDVEIASPKIGTFDTELAEEFWSAVTRSAAMNFHATKLHGRNAHHIVEAVFKAAARAMRMAVEIDPRLGGSVPSTKGSL